MGLDLDDIARPKTRWVDLGPQFHEAGPDGSTLKVEVLVTAATPRGSQRFRNRLTRDGVLRKDGTVADGQEDAFALALAREYVTDWRGPIKLGDQADPPYAPERMARVFSFSPNALKAVDEAVGDETRFFGQNGKGPTVS